jgi:hypothetical protein
MSSKYFLTALIVLSVLISFFAPPAFSQRQASAEVDSIVALLPQLRDSVKLNAIIKLTKLTRGQSVRKRYAKMLLNEARQQKISVSKGGRCPN